eukprot:211303-Karenia_brevis.AAC.1
MTIRIASDSKAVLGAFLKLRSPAPAINVMVRELALDLAEGRYHVDVHEHIAGTLNVWADALSRLSEPDSGAVIPEPLRHIPQASPGRRNPAWWEAA